MTPSDDEILISDSRNLSDDPTPTQTNNPIESEGASIKTLEDQGIFIENDDLHPDRVEPRDQLSKELEDLGGIEIIPDGE